MKKILLFGVLIVASFTGNSQQIPTGSICPNFTGTDISGNTWDLYSILDEGKTVIVEVSAAWCGPCWAYHSSHILKNFYNQYGPDGTNEAMVLFIEGENSNTEAQLHGPAVAGSYATQTQGDWVTGTPFPIIDSAQIGYQFFTSTLLAFPSVFMICPDRVIKYGNTPQFYQNGTVAFPLLSDWVSMMNQADCSAATAEVDPRFVNVTGQNATCTSSTASLNIIMQNRGTMPLTAATLTVTGVGTPIVYNWTGNLATYEVADVVIPVNAPTTSTTVTVSVTSQDENTGNSNAQATVSSWIPESTTHIRVVYNHDPWPFENSWKIKNSTGNVVASSPTFTGNGIAAGPTEIYDYWVPSLGCYSFEFTDNYGDGLNGAMFGGYNGNINVYVVDANGNNTTLIYSHDGSAPMIPNPSDTPVTHGQSFQATSTVSTDDLDAVVAKNFSVYPNPASGIVNLTYTLNRDSDVLIDVISSMGTRVMSEKLGSQKHGTYNTPVDLSSLAAGVYMITLNAGGAISTVRVVVR